MSICTKSLTVRRWRFAVSFSWAPWLRECRAVVSTLRCRDVVNWRCCWYKGRRWCGDSWSQQLVIVCRTVDGVINHRQLLSTNESLVARVTCEAVNVKHEFFDPHHQLRCWDCKLAFWTPRLQVPPVRTIKFANLLLTITISSLSTSEKFSQYSYQKEISYTRLRC